MHLGGKYSWFCSPLFISGYRRARVRPAGSDETAAARRGKKRTRRFVWAYGQDGRTERGLGVRAEGLGPSGAGRTWTGCTGWRTGAGYPVGATVNKQCVDGKTKDFI